MDAIEVINRLKKLSGPRFFEVYEKSTFQCYRNKKTGGVQKVTVEILDAGSDDENRYHCIATGDDGSTATGNPASTIEIVLATVHWGELDSVGLSGRS
jgi:hypothetical protein